MPVDVAEHSRDDTDSEDVVGVREEADAGDDDGADVVPAERSLVDFRESEAAALVGVGDVSVVIVEVVEGSCDTMFSYGIACCVMWTFLPLPPAVRVAIALVATL